MSRAYLSWAQLSLPTISLAVTAGQGRITAPTPTLSVQLTGQSGAGAVGAFGVGAPTRAYLSWVQLTLPASTGASAALIGQHGTGAAGSLLAQNKRVYLSWAQLQIPTATNITLLGQVGTGAIGSLANALGTVQALTGVSGTSAAGSVAKGSYGGLSGVQATLSAGSLTPGDENYGLAGILTPVNSESLASQSATGAVGVLAVLVDGAIQVQLIGQAGLGAAGSFSFTAGTAAIAGVAGTGAAGLESTTVSVMLTGQSGTGAISTLFQGTVQLQGLSATGEIGALGAGSSWVDVTPNTDIWTPVAPANSSWTKTIN